MATTALANLVRVSPRVAQRRELHELWVTNDILAVLNGGRPELGFPDARADRQITAFIAGYYVTVSLFGDPHKRRPDMERLRDLDEAWAICFRTPRPGWRLFGRFLTKGVFVGVDLKDRIDLNGEKTYAAKAQLAMDEWERVLPDETYLRSGKLKDYMYGAARDIDAPIL